MAQNPLIAALEHELADYLRRGKADRAAQVRQQLALLVGSVATTSETVPDEEGSTPPKPARATRKPAEAPKKAPAPKTPAKPKKAQK